jgi:hypothetical protein
VYATDLESQNISLGVSGLLWEGSLVMIDYETKSLWSHILGEAMKGPLQGTKLKVIPSVMTDWGSWKTSHPETTLVMMTRTADSYVREYHSRDGGLLIGLVTNSGTEHWSFADLFDKSPVNDVADDVPVAVSLDKHSFAATIYDRRVDGRTLKFETRDGKIVDSETESVWDFLSGRATSGELKGKQLKLLPGIVSDSAIWSLYYEYRDRSPPEKKKATTD